MPFARPKLSEIRSRLQADIDARLPGADSRLRRSVLFVLVTAFAGSMHALYGFLTYLSRQIHEDTADLEHLERQASVWGVSRKPAAFAVGEVDLTGSDGLAVPAGLLLQRSDGAEFATTAQAAILAGVATVTVTATAAGLVGNAESGQSLTVVSPPAGLDTAATVSASGITGGVDTESDAAFRARLLDHIRRRPHGGAAFDYEKWGLEVPGVTRVFVAPLEQGLGTVVVRFVLDDDPAGPIPAAAKVTEVQAYIDARRPVTANVIVLAPVAVPLDLTIQLTPNSGAVQSAVEASLRDLLRREAAPGATILISHIREAISIATGETDHIVTVPAGDVAHGPGQMATFGAITWV